jgi:putative DNA primase/helicase
LGAYSDTDGLKPHLKRFLKSNGVEFDAGEKKFKCPFHTGDDTASMGFVPKSDEQEAHCFACGRNADIYGFAALFYGLDEKRDFPEIKKRLASELGQAVYDTPARVKDKKPAAPEPPVTLSLEASRAVYTGSAITELGEFIFGDKLAEGVKIKIEKVWPCLNEKGNVEFVEARFAADCFKDNRKRPCAIWWTGKRLKSKNNPHGLFGRELLAANPEKPILIVEGPKCQEAAKVLTGFVPVAWNGGAQGQRKIDFSPLKGRRVYVWPDDDEAGGKSACVTAKLLQDVAAEIIIVEPLPEARAIKPEKADIVEALQVKAPEEIAAYILKHTPPVEAPKKISVDNPADEETDTLKEKGGTDGLKQLIEPFVGLAKNNNVDFDYVSAEFFSEAGAAEYIARGLGGRLLWCEPMGGWLVYDDNTGVFTTDHAEDALYETIKIYRKKFFEVVNWIEEEKQPAAFKFYMSMLEARTIRAIISILKHEPNVTALATDFNRDNGVINCAGTVVSIDGGYRPATPDDRFTESAICKPVYDFPENFVNFIDWSSCGDRELAEWKLTAYGVALFGHPSDKIINLYGKGRNGKGTELRTLFKIMKSYASTLARNLVVKEPGKDSRFDRETLVGKRLAVLFDLKPERGKFNIDELKTLCGNGDVQRVEPKGKKAYDAVIPIKVFIASNDKIPIDSFGPSEKERFYLVPFNNHIENKDETLEDRFVPEYGKILALLIEYAAKYYRNGRKMPQCKAIEQATSDYFDSFDLVGQFIQDKCEVGKDFYVKKSELYAKFTGWCLDAHSIKRPKNQKWLESELEKRDILVGVEHVYEGPARKSLRVFRGIR